MTIQLGNAPVSWGIYEFEEIAPKYPYTRVLDEMADTGYTGTELGPWNYLPTDPEVLRAELDKRGLRLLSAYIPINFVDPAAVEANESHALDVARLLAMLNGVALVLADESGRVPELVARAGRRIGSALNRDQWDTFAAGVNQTARRIFDATGLKVVFHHHCAGHVETPEEIRHLMDRADVDLVGLCLDTGHYHYGGGNALKAAEEYGERVRYLHLKDCDSGIRDMVLREKMDYFAATAAGIFCELGKGEVDFDGVITAVQKHGYQGWAIVEQDVLTNDMDAPKASARRNREFLRGLGL